MTDKTDGVPASASYAGHTYTIGNVVALSDRPAKVDLLADGTVKIKTDGDVTITQKPRSYTMIAETGVVGGE